MIFIEKTFNISFGPFALVHEARLYLNRTNTPTSKSNNSATSVSFEDKRYM